MWLVERPRSPAELRERGDAGVGAHDHVGEVHGAPAVPGAREHGRREELERRLGPARELHVGEPADERDVALAGEPFAARAVDELRLHAEPFPGGQGHVLVDRPDVRSQIGHKAERRGHGPSSLRLAPRGERWSAQAP